MPSTSIRCVRPGSSAPPSCGRSLAMTQETLLDPTSRTVNRRTLRPAAPPCDDPLPPRILIRASPCGIVLFYALPETSGAAPYHLQSIEQSRDHRDEDRPQRYRATEDAGPDRASRPARAPSADRFPAA